MQKPNVAVPFVAEIFETIRLKNVQFTHTFCPMKNLTEFVVDTSNKSIANNFILFDDQFYLSHR